MLFAFTLSLLAGLATAIGGCLAIHKKMVNRGAMAVVLAFAAGAMLFVSFAEILPIGIESLEPQMGGRDASLLTYGMFVLGAVFVAVIDKFLPQSFNPSKVEGREGSLDTKERQDNKRLMRSGVLVALVVALHNLPEGIATFLGALESPEIGLTLATAIAIHNIPEGIAIAAPVYAATKSKTKAVLWATVAGLAEPVGALIGFFFLSMLLPEEIFGVVFGLIAGMMVFISVDELLPAARRYRTSTHQVAYGLIGGMMLMAVSILLLYTA